MQCAEKEEGSGRRLANPSTTNNDQTKPTNWANNRWMESGRNRDREKQGISGSRKMAANNDLCLHSATPLPSKLKPKSERELQLNQQRRLTTQWHGSATVRLTMDFILQLAFHSTWPVAFCSSGQTDSPRVFNLRSTNFEWHGTEMNFYVFVFFSYNRRSDQFDLFSLDS